MAGLFLQHGVPQVLRSDNGSEMTAKAVREFLGGLEVGTLTIEPGSPWESGYIESFNGKLSDDLLDGEVLTSRLEAQDLVEQWRRHYNTERSHISLGYRPPALEAHQRPPLGAAA